MRSASTKHAIELANAAAGPLSVIAAKAIEVGVIVPSILKAALAEAEYAVTFHDGPGEDAKEGKGKHGAWCLVRKGDAIVARAFSHDEGDALVQAIYAAMKEEAAAAKAAS